MNLLDLLLLLAALAFAVSGYRQGFIVGVLSFVGFLGGGFLGMWLLPKVYANGSAGLRTPLVAIVAVLVAATIGQVLAGWVGGRLRGAVTWRPARLLDAVSGAAVSVVALLVTAWFLGTAVAQSPVPSLVRLVRGSEVLAAVGRVMPPEATVLFSSFRRVLDSSGFPEVFSGIRPEGIAQVGPPDPAVVSAPGLAAARPSIVKVLGAAPACNREVEGSGFVFAPERVMTNAHVVAGVTHPRVLLDGTGAGLPAQVVLFDPQTDLAVLYVPGLRRTPLAFRTDGRPGDSAIVAGYPKNGPFTAVPARLRSEVRARGSDIYGQQPVTREIYALRGDVESGNSGGPLVAPDGRVYGVIFAKSVEDPQTGYALTAAQAAADAGRGAGATAPVPTGGCT